MRYSTRTPCRLRPRQRTHPWLLRQSDERGRQGFLLLGVGWSIPRHRLRCVTPPHHALGLATSRNPRQRFWLIRAILGPSQFATSCHQLRPLGSINAPSLTLHPTLGIPGANRVPEGRDVHDSSSALLQWTGVSAGALGGLVGVAIAVPLVVSLRGCGRRRSTDGDRGSPEWRPSCGV
jgi:hypothetical protein